MIICFLLKSGKDSVCQRSLDGVALVAQRIDQMHSSATSVAHALLLLTTSNKYRDSSKSKLFRREEEGGLLS